MAARVHGQQEEGWNQQKKRAVGVFFDQHKSATFPNGRPWWGWTEAPAEATHERGVVGELQPVGADLTVGDGSVIRGWDAPWIPEQKYVLMSLNVLGAGNRFKIDYPRQITDYRAANDRYYRLAAQTAGARNWPAPALYGPVEFQLRALIGEPPRSPKIPEAALAEDPWVLGFAPQPNERIASILEREQGRSALREAPEPSVASVLDALSPDERSEIADLLRERRQAKAMRDAKAAKSTPSTDKAA